MNKAVLWCAAVVVAVVAFFLFRAHERQVGALAVASHVVDSTAKVERDSIAKAIRTAQEAASQAEAAKGEALKQLASTKALAAKNDSLLRSASDERAHDTRLLADSGATRDSLRAALIRQLAQARTDSVAFAAERQAVHQTLASLLLAIAKDSVALHAEQSHSASLQALNATLTRQLAIQQHLQPSFLARHLALTAGYGVVDHGGVVYAGPSLVAGWKLLP